MVIEWGSIADWFNGTVTTLGILGSLYWNYNNSRIKVNLDMEDRSFSIENHRHTTGKIVIRIYNRGNRTIMIDEIGMYVHKVDGLIVKKYIPITSAFFSNEGNISYSKTLFSESAYVDELNIKDITSTLIFYLNNDDATVIVAPYIKMVNGRYIEGHRKNKMEINLKNFSINDAEWFDMNEEH